jgi:serine protease Do
MDGQVIGVNSAIVARGGGNDGVGFAIPIDMAAHVADKLIKDGKVSRARIGIALQVLTPTIAEKLGLDPKTRGVLVSEVLPGSPAEKAGLKTGDVIVGFNGEPVQSVPSFRLNVAASDVGKSFELKYYRNGKEHATTITPAPSSEVVFAQEKKTEEKGESSAGSEKAEVADLGLEVQPLTPALAAQFGLPKGTEGLLVSSVKEGSPAEAAGLQAGQVITKVVREKKLQAAPSVKEFQDLARHSDELALYVQSSEGSRFVTLSKAPK